MLYPVYTKIEKNSRYTGIIFLNHNDDLIAKVKSTPIFVQVEFTFANTR